MVCRMCSRWIVGWSYCANTLGTFWSYSMHMSLNFFGSMCACPSSCSSAMPDNDNVIVHC